MRLSVTNGQWVPTVGGIPCPHLPDLTVELIRKRTDGLDSEYLHVIFRTVDSLFFVRAESPVGIRHAIWSPLNGVWVTVAEDMVDQPLRFRHVGLSLGWHALGEPPPRRVARWLASFLADPVSLLLALRVMDS